HLFSALLVIDIQHELTKIDEGSNEYKQAIGFPRMIANTKLLVEAVRANREKEDNAQVSGSGSEIIFTYLEALTDNSRDVSLDYKLSGPGLSNLPTPSSPATFFPGISPIPGKDIALPKTSCSVFQSTNLDYILRNLNVEQLVVCGQLTDQCVESAVRDAADLGYLVTVVEDACGAENEDSHQKGLHGMQGFARRVETEQVLRELSGSSTASATDNDEGVLAQDLIVNTSLATAPAGNFAISIPKPSEFLTNTIGGCHAAILRSLRAAGVKFLRYAVVDAFNTIRCKMVPLNHAIASLPSRTQRNHAVSLSSPLDNPVSIAEICFAGLPAHADVPVASSNLTARNVLTLQPDFSSLRVLPYAPRTAMIMCTAHNQQTKYLSPFCTRGLLERVLHEAREGMGVEFCVGAELEFQLFYSEPQDGLPQPVDMTTFANAVTLNEQEDFISTLYEQLGEQDIPIELIHAESAPGQMEVVLSYTSNVMQVADDVVLTRETITACAKKFGMKALFLPKTSMMTAGSGLHLHFSFRNVGESSSDNLFSDPTQPIGISLRGGSFIEGLLGHLPSLLSFSLPTVNSFRRVGPGCWTGNSVGWSTEDKDAPLRVCVDLNTGNATNVELKLSDATANIYLELAMVLAAGMDGMKNGQKLRPMIDDAAIEPLPNSLQESLDLLKKNSFLLSVLGPELGTAYVAVRESEAQIEKTLEEEVMNAFNKA
ncbi:hypothetical protein ACHAXR_003171, partial [Thalassiosira sp. AJA248-18]